MGIVVTDWVEEKTLGASKGGLSVSPRSSAKSDRGSALVELAISLPLLALILVGTVDFARVFYTSIALTNAARAGAQYGAANLAQSGNSALMEATARDAVPNITDVTAVASRVCECATDSGVADTTIPPNNCAAAVVVSCHGLHRLVTVTVTTTKTFRMNASFVGLPSSIPLRSTATLQVSE